jgi:integrase
VRHKWNKKVACLVKPLRAYFGHIRAVDLSKIVVTNYMVKLQAEGYADASINRRTQLLSQAFTIADRVPPKVKRLSECANVRQGYFERGEWLLFRECLPDYLQDFFEFAYLLGWRKGSIAKLKWSDIDGTRVLLRAENSKNRKPVTCPAIAPGIAEIIERRRAQQVEGCPYVFHYTRNGKTRPIGDTRKTRSQLRSWQGSKRKSRMTFAELRYET